MNAPVPTRAVPRPPKTLEQVAAAAAALIAEARQARLTIPCAVHCHDYPPAGVSLFISDYDTPDTMGALQQWAARYSTDITARPSSAPETTVYAYAEWHADGIRWEVYSVLHPDTDATEETDWPAEDDGPEDDSA